MGKIVCFKEMEKRKMENILDVARYFLSLEGMNHKKLQKLCYYAQAWNLALRNMPLMNARFEAWVHGPVSPELYSRYRDWGGLTIPQRAYSGNLEPNSIDFLNKIYSLYGRYTPSELEQLTHEERPWQVARGGYEPNAICRETIDEHGMAQFYREYLH